MAKPKNSKAANAKPQAKPPSTAPPTPPQWPALTIPKPPSPIPHPSCPTKILLIKQFFPPAQCKRYVDFLRTLPLSTTPGRPRRGEAVRVNDRFQVEDEGFAWKLWRDTGLGSILGREEFSDLWGGELVGLSPNIRVYRYSKGQFFDCHYDDSNTITLSQPSPQQCKTTWTLLLYLTSSSEGCIGGETVFYPTDNPKKTRDAVAVSPETGMLLLHRHGDDCMLHEGREVTAGEKWILRTDICVRR